MNINKRVFLFFIIGLCVLIGVGVIFSTLTQKAAQAPQQQNTQLISSPSPIEGNSQSMSLHITSSKEISPADTVKNFYIWYISYVGNPLASGEYKKNTSLTNAYKQIITGFLSASPSAGYDPVFCTINKTKNPALEQIPYTPTDTQTTVIIHDGDVDAGKSVYRVVLKYEKNKWMIDDIICLP